MAGQHGIWQKQCFYEASVRVPFIVRGPGLSSQVRISENVSLVDIMPTLLDFAGTEIPEGLRGESLRPLFEGMGAKNSSVVLSEYHSQGMLNAGYMVKKGHYKYNYYVGENPQLFDLDSDPGEFNDLSQDPRFAALRDELHQELLKILDPEQVDQKAKFHQTNR
jgi:choline-sulfatase